MNPLHHVHLEDIKPFELAPGAVGRPLFGESAMVNLVELEPGSVFPLHSHPHEQLGVVLRGEQVLVLDGVEYPLGPMDGYVIPAGVEHSPLRAGRRDRPRYLPARARGLPRALEPHARLGGDEQWRMSPRPHRRSPRARRSPSEPSRR